jgi:sulfur-oxidizing protein SoxY
MGTIRWAMAALTAVGLWAEGSGHSAAAEEAGAAWAELSGALFPNRTIAEAGDMITLDAPYRAHDAAAVPLEIRITPPLGRSIARFTLLIDENPAPVAAEVEVGPGLGREIALSTRVRVDAYSNVRVIAELDDGALYQSARFVKASGGCSAPAAKDAEAAVANAGKMKLRTFAEAAPEAQLLVRHPNHSGFQMDQVTLLPIPPWFVDVIEVTQGGALVMRVTGGISLSEDPALRFRYVPNGAAALDVRVEDTEGGVFEAAFPVAGS